MEKIKVIYERWNPKVDGVAYVAIQSETVPPFVWKTYSSGDKLPNLPDYIALLPRKAADNLFKFKKGKISDCKRPDFGFAKDLF